MSHINTGGPAFPHTVEYKGAECGGVVPHGGMTLRDYFATEAMKCIGELRTKPYNNLDSTAEIAYKMADAMLKAREA
jgi:hypothetical protein